MLEIVGSIIHFCDIDNKREWKLKIRKILPNGSSECLVLKSKKLL